MDALRTAIVANWYTWVFIGVLLFATPASAQGWAHTYGGFEHEAAVSVRPTSGGGYAVAANRSEFWLLELDAEGEVLSQRTYGGPGGGVAAWLQQTGDGGYVVAGSTGSLDEPDAWVLKLDGDGVIEWQKRYGGEASDRASFVEAVGEGYVVGGTTRSFGAGEEDLWVLLLDGEGEVLWQKAYGGADPEAFGSLRSTADGGFVLSGFAHSFSDRNGDFWVVKLEADGDIEWEHIYGLDTAGIENSDFPPGIVPIETPQGAVSGYLMAGMTWPWPSGTHGVWALELDVTGQVVWQKRYWTGGDDLNSLQPVSGGYLIASSLGGAGTGGNGGLMKIDAAGDVLWQRRYGGEGLDDRDSLAFATENASGGLVAAGVTHSFGIDEGDVWVLELDATGDLDDCPAIGPRSSGTAATSEVAIATSATVTAIDSPAVTTNAAVASPSYYKEDGCRLQPLGWASIPKSGQVTTYEPGDDGDLRPGVPWPSPRFVDNEDGTISDRLTGLMWLTDANCAGTLGYEPGGDNVGGALDWAVALDFVAGLNDGTHDITGCVSFDADDRDWRMANINEMETLVNAEQLNLAGWLVSRGFENVQSSGYWSSTTHNTSQHHAVMLQLGTHEVRSADKSHPRYLWPVRGGPSRAPDPDVPANVFETGQTASYHPGDDGDLRWGVTWPDPRFITHADGTITDRLTGLTWLRDARCPGEPNWANALAVIADFNTGPDAFGCEGYTGDYDDWRLPNRKELRSLIQHDRWRVGLPVGHPFVNTQIGHYWTSNTLPSDRLHAWGFYVGASGVLQKYTKNLYGHEVWPVRGGPVPEPGAVALGIAAIGTLLALRRRRWTGGRSTVPLRFAARS